jgi:hypothetical protein
VVEHTHTHTHTHTQSLSLLVSHHIVSLSVCLSSRTSRRRFLRHVAILARWVRVKSTGGCRKSIDGSPSSNCRAPLHARLVPQDIPMRTHVHTQRDREMPCQHTWTARLITVARLCIRVGMPVCAVVCVRACVPFDSRMRRACGGSPCTGQSLSASGARSRQSADCPA